MPGLSAAHRRLSSTTPPLAALPTAPGTARGLVKYVLAMWGLQDFLDVAELVTGELAANAVIASGPVREKGGAPVIRVCLITDGEVLTIECWDQAPGWPALTEASDFAESGRGLALIDHLTGGAWGCQPAINQTGKCVWAEIRLRGLFARFLSLALAITDPLRG
jgi:anti-sigma regulatory factor (Ser/Thr protein kinase)